MSQVSTKVIHSGHFGDIIYGLRMLKEAHAINGKKFIFHLYDRDDLLSRYPGEKPKVLNPYLLLKDLLNAQPYISQVVCYSAKLPPPTDVINLDRFRNFIGDGTVGKVSRTHLAACHFVAFSVPYNSSMLSQAWLTVPQTAPKRDSYAVISKTSRYNNQFHNNWERIVPVIEGRNVQRVYFVGHQVEMQRFETFVPRRFFKRIEFYPTENFLELAQLIDNAEVFAGNTSAALAVAAGLNCPRLLDIDEPLNLMGVYCGSKNEMIFL